MNNIIERIRIGTRKSKLAVIQAKIVRDLIKKKFPDIEIEIIPMNTTGDMILDRRLDEVGGKGLFIKELETAHKEGIIDISVHSLKDMPMELPEEFPIFAYTSREDPRDALILSSGTDVFPEDGLIATSSRRREIQIKKLYPNCRLTDIRGNVPTRLKKLSESPIDGTVLAVAGLRRLQMDSVIGKIFNVEEVVPAAGQGILAVQGSEKISVFLKEALNDPLSEAAALAERQFIRVLDGGCSSPCAAYAEIHGSDIRLTGLYYRDRDDSYYIEEKSGEAKDAVSLGDELARGMIGKYE